MKSVGRNVILYFLHELFDLVAAWFVFLPHHFLALCRAEVDSATPRACQLSWLLSAVGANSINLDFGEDVLVQSLWWQRWVV